MATDQTSSYKALERMLEQRLERQEKLILETRQQLEATRQMIAQGGKK